MRGIAIMAALLLSGSILVFAQAGGGQAPPGGDMVGSDHQTQRPGHASRSDPEQTQRMTNTMGTTRGDEHQPAYAGRSTHASVASQSESGVKGQQGKTAATAARRRSHNQTQSAYDSTGKTSQQQHKKSSARRRKQKTTQQASEPRQ